MAITILNNRAINRTDTASAGENWTATSATASDFQVASGLNQSAFRNIIINGDMSLAQRGTSVTGITSSTFNTVDRFGTGASSAGTWTQSQSTDVPTGQGFAKSLKMDCTTAQGTLGSGDRLQIYQKFEGQNLQYLKKGTSSAESTTVSFWVKSNKTGTYIAELYDSDNTRHIAKSYTISNANTWEKKTITYAGDTSGAFTNDNGESLAIYFWLVAGSDFNSGTLATSWASVTNANRAKGQVNLSDSTSNDWYVTGVQLETGTSASDFEYLPVDVNSQRCHRYYYTFLPLGSLNKYFLTGYYYSTGYIYCNTLFPTIMRASPSLEQVGGTNYYQFYSASSGDTFDDFTNTQTINPNSAFFGNNSDVSGTAGNAGAVYCGNNAAYVAFTAEL